MYFLSTYHSKSVDFQKVKISNFFLLLFSTGKLGNPKNKIFPQYFQTYARKKKPERIFEFVISFNYKGKTIG